MSIQLTDQEKYQIFEEIINSSEFENSSKYCDLLKYLVEASIKGESVKETTIAYEFFGKDASYNSSEDSTIRANIYNLRKKLEHYYLTEGKNATIKLTLPKGHYGVLFKQIVKKEKGNLKFLKGHTIYILIILLLVTLLFVQKSIFWFFKPENIISDSNPVWSEMFDSENKTMLVVGDYYFFSRPLIEGRATFIRDVEINSDQDLEEFLVENPDFNGLLGKTFNTYIDESIPWSFTKILPSFSYYNIYPEVKLSSELQLDELQGYNILYIGSYKSLNVLKTVVDYLHFDFSLGPHLGILTFQNIDSLKEYVYDWQENEQTNARNDYAMVIKVAGQKGNTFLFFLSLHDFGNMATIKYFLKDETLKSFSEKVGSGSFEALFEVTGVFRTDFSIRLLHVNKLKSDFRLTLE